MLNSSAKFLSCQHSKIWFISSFHELNNFLRNQLRKPLVHVPTVFVGQRLRQQLFDVHGVHLTEEGNKAYCRSVRVAVEKGLKRLSK